MSIGGLGRRGMTSSVAYIERDEGPCVAVTRV